MFAGVHLSLVLTGRAFGPGLYLLPPVDGLFLLDVFGERCAPFFHGASSRSASSAVVLEAALSAADGLGVIGWLLKAEETDVGVG